MSSLRDALQPGTYNWLFEPSTDEIGPLIIDVLRERSGAVSVDDLAERLAATAPGSTSGGTASWTTEQVLIRLHHVHLPKLTDSGLVEWDGENQQVAATDHPVYDTIQPEERLSIGDRGSIVPGLAEDRRQEVLAIVESENGPIAREDLVRELASAEVDGEPSEPLLRDVTIQLHHRDLPRLEEAGLVEYDPDAGTVAYRGPTGLTAALAEPASE